MLLAQLLCDAGSEAAALFGITRVAFGVSEGAIYGMAAADLDGDGFPEILAARSGAISLFFNNRPATATPSRMGISH